MPDLRAALFPSPIHGVVNSIDRQAPNRRSGSVLASPVQRFAIANCLAMLPQLLLVYVFSQGDSTFILLVLLWNMAPIVTSSIFFVAGARPAAWGWLVAVALWETWTAISVVASHSSSASLGFMWAPIWSFTLVGPIGAGIALLHVRRQRIEKR